jgi:hypothetical protein
MGTSAGSSSAGAVSTAAGCSAAGEASACGVVCSSSLLPHAESSEQDRAITPMSETDCSFMAKLHIKIFFSGNKWDFLTKNIHKSLILRKL